MDEYPLTNGEKIVERIADFQKRLSLISEQILQKDADSLWKFFATGRDIRQEMEIHKRAGVDSFYDIFIMVPDEEDVILKVLELLRGISVVNIRINEENREDIHGILQITFKNKGDLDRAAQVIRTHTSYPFTIK